MCEFAVGIDEGEQSFAGAADCIQTDAYLFFGYFFFGEFQQSVAKGGDRGYGVHNLVGQYTCETCP